MKTSKYNLIFEDNGEKYIYNAFTNSFARINDTVAKVIENWDTMIDEGTLSEASSSLRKGGFIIENTKDELSELKVRNVLGRFSNSGFGITLAPTLACNFKCRYCFEQPSPNMMTNEIIDGVYNFVLRNLKGKSSFGVCWYGGEPLLALDIIKNLSKRFIALCQTLNIPYEADIISNGFLMNEETAGQLANEMNIRFWQVTLDGPQHIHDQRRPTNKETPTFNTILGNIKSCYQYFDRVSVRINIDKSNYEYVPELLDKLDEEGLKNKVSVYLGMVQAFGAVCKSVSGQCFSEKEFSEKEALLYNIALQKGFRLSLRPRLLTNYCSADRNNSFLIDPLGNLAKCWNSVGVKEESVGTIFEAVLNDNYVKWLAYSPFYDTECTNCAVLPLCMGGCPYDAIVNEKKTCRSMKYNLNEILKLHRKTVNENYK